MTSLMPMGMPPSGRETSACSASLRRLLEIPREEGLDLGLGGMDAELERAQEIDGAKGLGAETVLNFGNGEAWRGPLFDELWER